MNATRTARTSNRVGNETLLLWLVRLGTATVLLTPLIVSRSTLSPYIVGKALFARSVITVTFAAWLILIWRNPKHRPAKSLIVSAGLIWLLISLIAGFTGVSHVRSLWSTYERMQGVIDQAHWLAFIVIAGSVFRNMSAWRALLTINLAVAATVCGLGLVDHFGVSDIKTIGNSNHLSSTLGNSSYLGAYTAVSAITGVGLVVHSLAGARTPSGAQRRQNRRFKNRRRAGRRAAPTASARLLQALWIAATLLCLWCLWLTTARSALLGLGAGFATLSVGYILLGVPGTVRRVAFSLLAVTLAASALLTISRFTAVLDPVIESSRMLQRIDQLGRTGADFSATKRTEALEADVNAFKERPILGWGTENYLIAWGRHVKNAEDVKLGYFDHAHNKLMQELVTKGLLGLLSYLLVWSALIYVLYRSLRRSRSPDDLLVLAIGAALLAFFTQSIFQVDHSTTNMLFALLAAYAVSNERWLRGAADDRAATRSAMPLATIQLLAARLATVRRILQKPVGSALLSTAIICLAVLVLYNYNLKLYRAAQIAGNGVNAVSWYEADEHLRDAINRFPPLANFPRTLLTRRATTEVVELSESDLAEAILAVESENEQLFKTEPQNWRSSIDLAYFYQLVALRDITYLDTAKRQVEETVRLAPATRDTLLLQEDYEQLLEIVESE